MEAHLLYLHIFLLFFPTVSADDSVFTEQVGTPGEDVELGCLVPEGTVVVLEWKQSNRYLLFYRDGKNVKRYRDERFADRVRLQDPQMTSGNLGVILQNVTPEDSGDYTCKVLVQTSGGERRDFTRIVQLSVSEPEEKSPVYQPLEAQNNDETMREDNTVNGKIAKSISRAEADEDNFNFTALAVGVGVVALIVFVVFGIVFKKREQLKPWLQKKEPNPDLCEKNPLEPECLP
ncbi:ICOS ligand-like [Eucyclogobius newberryi]|uniref:ICOS ligand-like n=1 Tax=Eucyclogobius newberryi TaxID=166745 RepID=UPI003B5AC7DF